MDIHYYRAKVKHDKGKVNLYLSAASEQAARMLIQAAEGCPQSAIQKVTPITKRQYIIRNK